MTLRIRLLISLISAGLIASMSVQASERESFTVSFGAEGNEKTIGDLRPKVIALEQKPVPDVSIKYVMKRYRKLFENAKSPEVRIEALNRINNLSASYGIVEKDLNIDPYVQAEVVLDTYQKIVDSGRQYQRMDQLLYQTAKATAFTGDILESIKRLELLVGLYPNSPLAEEALFRLGESYFELAEFTKAKDYYTQLLKRTKAPALTGFAEYKLAWSNYRLEKSEDSIAALSRFFEAHSDLRELQFGSPLEDIVIRTGKYQGFDLNLEPGLLNDGMRLLAILAERGDRLNNVATYGAKLRGGEKLVLRALVDQLADKQRYFDAARLIEAYAETAPRDKDLFLYYNYAVALYDKGEHKLEAWKAKTNLIASFGVQSDYWRNIPAADKPFIQPKLADLTYELARYRSVTLQESEQRDQRYIRLAREAASYYLQFAALAPNDTRTFEAIFFAAQSLEEAGQHQKASGLYERVAYADQPNQYKYQSAYAALIAEQTSSRNQSSGEQINIWGEQSLMLGSRLLEVFPDHQQAPSVALNLAEQIERKGRVEEAKALLRNYANYVAATPSQRVNAGLRLAVLEYNTAQTADDFGVAEQAYQQVSLLLENNDLKNEEIASTKSLVMNGIVESRFKQAELAEDKVLSANLYASVYEFDAAHSLASAALFNAASLSIQTQSWQKAERLHAIFLESFPEDELVDTSRQQLILALESMGQTQQAAETLMLQAKALLKRDPELSANSAYKAAGYFVDNAFMLMARDAYEWLLSNHSGRHALAIEALAFMMQQAGEATEAEYKAAERLLSYVERNSLTDSRSKTLAAVGAMALAGKTKREFEQARIAQPFAKSLKAKTKLLEVSGDAYRRVIAFGISEYSNAARYEMATIYQSLAHAIMDSERPSGLSPLEQEQYEILLEEQAIPIEEEAISLFEQNIRERGDVFDEWIVASYSALATLNPALYERPIKGPSYAPFVF